MSMGSFPAKDPAERPVVAFDWTHLLDGETISAATFTASLLVGTDASPSSLISGSAVIDGAETKQRLGAGVAGCTYKIKCTMTTSAGRILVECAALQVRDC